jgi:CheY-like chemotaxis protein
MSIQDTLRAKFLDQFVQTARQRTADCQSAVSRDDSALALDELHTLAGEASMLGFEDIGALAREAEQEARAWAEGNSADRVKCGRSLRLVIRAVDRLCSEGADPVPVVASEPSAPRLSQVLVIDDSELVAEQIQEGLEAQGVGVGIASTLDEAVQQATRAQPMVILADVHIPGVETSQLVASVREASKDSKIFLVSGLSDSELAEKVNEVAADGYLSKQGGLDQVVSGVVQALAGSRT